MASWAEVEAAAPELAADVRRRFDAYGLAILATLRADGSPRVHGIEPLFAVGHVWLGMMEGSRKAADLRRDPRLAMHSATTDKNVSEGDAKLGGRAVEVVDPDERASFEAALAAASEHHPEPGTFPVFRVDVTDISFLRPAGDHLDIRWWREGSGEGQVDRY